MHFTIVGWLLALEVVDAWSVEMRFQFKANAFSTGELLAQPVPLSPIHCAAECSKQHNCAAYNIKDSFCQLLPPSVDALLTNVNSSYYWDKYYNMTYDPVFKKYYSKVSTDRVTWPKAVEICTSRGQHLMEIRNQLEQDRIDFVAESANIWLGMYRRSAERLDIVYASDESNLAFTNWYEPYDEPNMIPEDSDSNCIATYEPKDYKWFDAPCTDSTQFFVCMTD